MNLEVENEQQAVPEYSRIAFTPVGKKSDRRRIQRAREVLQRQEVNNSVNYGKMRHAIRYGFNRPVIAIIPPAEYAGFDETVQVVFNCWANNLSQSGLSIIVGRTLLPVLLDDNAYPVLPTTEVIESVDKLEIGLIEADDTIVWVDSHLVRSCPSCEDLLEVGIRFEKKHEEPRHEGEDFLETLRPYLI